MTMTGGDPAAPPPVVPGGLTINMPTQSAPAVPAPGAPPEGFMSRADVEALLNQERERVRQEEKDKLYPELTQLRDSLGTLTTEREQRLQAEQAAEQARQEEEQRRIAEESSAKDLLETTTQNFQRQLDEMRADRERERAIFAREQELTAVNEYKMLRIGQERDNIAPQFDDLIRGNNQAEIDASIEAMKAKTAEIVGEFQAAAGAGANGGRPAPPPLPVSGAPTLDPTAMAGDTGQQTYTPEELYSMPLEDYSRLRPQLLGAVSQRVRDNGLYAP